MKRITALLFSAMLLFALASCASGGETTQSAVESAQMSTEAPAGDTSAATEAAVQTDLPIADTPAESESPTAAAPTAVEKAPTAPQTTEKAPTAPAAEKNTPAQAAPTPPATAEEPAAQDVPQTDGAENKVLVVYFSWSGNLHKMAGWIADETGGDLIRVTAQEAYPEDYTSTANRAKQEQDDGVRPAINAALTAQQLAQSDTVFFGFPVWWYDLPMPMWTLLESYDFSGKTVIPFFSHEGSSNGAGALPRLTELAKGATVKTGEALSIRGSRVSGSESDVRSWVNGLGYSK